MNETLQKIRALAHWAVRIVPETSGERVNTLKELEDAVQTCSVSLRGWDYPHYDLHTLCERSSDYIEQSIEWDGIGEFWRAYKSGQFLSFCAFYEDRKYNRKTAGSGDSRDEIRWLNVEDSVHRLAEIFEFASRWATRQSFSGKTSVICRLNGLAGRKLFLSPARRGSIRTKDATQDNWEFAQDYDTADLVSSPFTLAIEPAVRLLEIFGLDIADSTVEDIQSELRS